MGSLNEITVHPETKTAWVQPGVTNGELVDRIGRHDLAFPTGHCSDVGLGGYLLGGGLGWNGTLWGPACWSVVGIEGFETDGEPFVANERQHADLLWAAQGGGAAFPALVTGFQLRLHPLPQVTRTKLTFPVETLPSLLAWMQTTRIPGAEISVVCRAVDSLDRHGRSTARVVITGFAESADAARELVSVASTAAQQLTKPWNQSPVLPASFLTLEGDGDLGGGQRYAVDGGWIGEDVEAFGQWCVGLLASAPSPQTRFVFARAQFPEPASNCAFSPLGKLTGHAYASWDSQELDAENLTWLDTVSAGMDETLAGFWPAQSRMHLPGRPMKSFAHDKWIRLNRIRERYDPEQRKFGFLESVDSS